MVIHLEAKDKLVKRRARSPDKGDAAVMAWFSRAKAITNAQAWRECAESRWPIGPLPKVILAIRPRGVDEVASVSADLA